MAATQPVLAGYTLEHPKKDGYREIKSLKGAFAQMANGSFIFDGVGTGGLTGVITFEIEWVALTNTQKATLESAYNALAAAESGVSFTTPTGAVYTVGRNPQDADLSMVITVKAGGIFVWNCRLSLRTI